MNILFTLFVIVLYLSSINGCCPNRCNGRGICTSLGNGCICDCFTGFTGGDCSMIECPVGRAWSDIVSSIDSAHQLAECSNRGVCDHTTGRCTCDIGFTGSSCNRKVCPNSCSGHGECRSMRYHATMRDLGIGAAVSYTTNWDSDMMHGCVCNSGYTGPDCSLRECPKGDDPLTTGQVNEIQSLLCSASSGTFTLSFRGETTTPLSYNAQSNDISNALLALITIDGISVSYSSGSTACTSGDDAANTITITFSQNFGSLPKITPDVTSLSLSDGTPSITVTKETSGTKENEPCSNRGSCDLSSGVCTCYSNYATSDGNGGVGNRGDCGRTTDTILTCPGEIICSGHGTCSGGSEYRCTCFEGWTSGDCSERSCPKGNAWFDEASSNNVAHEPVECSGKGICVKESGQCACSDGYEGAACERLKCPGSTPCSGHGTCLTMKNLAEHAEINGVPQIYTYGETPNKASTWDANKIQGCLCDSRYTGHDCSQLKCPTGDNPRTTNQYHEIQTIVCTSTSTSSTFRLIFRGRQTVLIAASATISNLKTALENLSSIGTVEISYSNGSSACTTDGSNKISIKFLSEYGDLPAIDKTITNTNEITGFIIDTDGVGDSTKGTMENTSCSDNGLCNHSIGRCTCFSGMMSSGSRNDCGHVTEVQIISE